MIIEMNRDIEHYKETVVMGLTAKQLLFSILSVLSGSGIVLFLHQHIGLTASVYIAVPIVVPVALGGFYGVNGMGFYEMMYRRIFMIFLNRPLTYYSTENELLIRQAGMMSEEEENRKRTGKKKSKKRNLEIFRRRTDGNFFR